MDTEVNDRAPETKAGLHREAYATHDDVMQIYESYKAAQDERFAQLEKRTASNAATLDQADRVNAALDAKMRKLEELNLKAARPALEGTAANARRPTLAQMEHKSAFNTYVRRGDATSLSALETKALSVGSNPDGGYLVPPEIEHDIIRRVTTISPIRAISAVREMSASVYRKPVLASGPAVGWVGETAPRLQSASPVLDELSFPAMELYAMPAATSTLLEDAAVNIDEWLAAEVEQAFAEQEGAAFVTGDGVNKPRGFLSYPKVAEAAWTSGNIGYLATGSAGAFPNANPSDVLIDLVYSVKAKYRQNANFVMNRRMQSAVRKLKDTAGNYLWQPPAQFGGRASLMGFPVIESEDMPDMADGAFAIAFGDFGRGYLIVDRQGVRVLRDPYTAKPYVLFYTTKRVGGGVQDFEAIKLLKFAAS